jgi:2'-5' RNA ligase
MPQERAEPAEAKPLRLFAAVEIPKRTREEVERAVAPLRRRYPEGKWVRSENWHVTVKFLGRTMPDVVDRVREACARATERVRPFRVQLEAPGVFPRPTSARVLWIGLRDEGEGLGVLARALDRELARDFPSEKRPFTAHLTVARFDPRVRVEPDELESAVPKPSPFRIGELVLFRSHLSPKGARYEPLERFALRG